MVSNNQEVEQIVVSKDVTPTSSPKKTNEKDRSGPKEASSSKQSIASKVEKEMKTIGKIDEEDVETTKVVTEEEKKIIVKIDDEDIEITTDVEEKDIEVDLVDTCEEKSVICESNRVGGEPIEEKIIICDNSRAEGEHIEEKNKENESAKKEAQTLGEASKVVPCTEDKDGARKGEGEDTKVSSKKRKAEIYVDFSEYSERAASKRPTDLKITRREPIPDLNEPIPDLNLESNLNEPIPDLNLEPNLDKSLGGASSSSGSQAQKPEEPSQAPVDDKVEPSV